MSGYPLHRRPPVPYKNAPDGDCILCGLHIDVPDGSKRRMHPECVTTYLIANNPEIARREVAKRDKEICGGCGRDCSNPIGFVSKGLGTHFCGYPYTEIAPIPAWHVDHKIPLWKVMHLPDIERFWYFTIANMQTFCALECHSRKTTEEAAERGKYKRLHQKHMGEAKTKEKKKWGSRPLLSRSSFGRRP